MRRKGTGMEGKGRKDTERQGKEASDSSLWEEADWLLEAESSLSVQDLKRKGSPCKKQRSKKRKLEKLVGWGEASSLEGYNHQPHQINQLAMRVLDLHGFQEAR